MQLIIRELRLPLNYKDSQIKAAAARRAGVRPQDIVRLQWLRQSVDARRERTCFRFTVLVELRPGTELAASVLASAAVAEYTVSPRTELLPGTEALTTPPVIVGTGPAGLFCAYLLAQHGYAPVLIERGDAMEQRIAAVEQLVQQRRLDPSSNVQFGEGGAGTFSDGKLTTRIGDARVEQVLRILVEHGAPPEIMYQKKAHVGTDYIRAAVQRMRHGIEQAGGQVHFRTCLTDINIHRGAVRSINLNETYDWPCHVLVLATGHSARDTYRMLERRGVELKPKAFAMGLRVEHPQTLIDRLQYGRDAGHPQLPPADYQLRYHDAASGRAVYSFCMCPGGEVIAAASDTGQCVTNGMSWFARASGRANSALLVTVQPGDWSGRLGGIAWQEALEQRAFQWGGSDYNAPAQRLTDFVAGQLSPAAAVTNSIASYAPGVVSADLWALLPAGMAALLADANRYWERKMPGWLSPDAVLTGVESRSSAPVRIERNPAGESVSAAGLYPCGEGAGYAGGIVSAAVDGLKVAETIIRRYKNS